MSQILPRVVGLDRKTSNDNYDSRSTIPIIDMFVHNYLWSLMGVSISFSFEFKLLFFVLFFYSFLVLEPYIERGGRCFVWVLLAFWPSGIYLVEAKNTLSKHMKQISLKKRSNLSLVVWLDQNSFWNGCLIKIVLYPDL